MTLDLGTRVPASLAPSVAAMTIGIGPECARASHLAQADAFDRVLSTFAGVYDRPDHGALMSMWSMYYFSALVLPATAALLCRDTILPVGFEEIGTTIGPTGLVVFHLADGGRPAGVGTGRRFESLVEGHIAPFVSLCTARAGLSPRVFWHNAAVMLDCALGEFRDVETIAAARKEAEGLLDGSVGACRLAHPLRGNADGTRTRRVCCLRYRLPCVADCGSLCPRGRSN